MEEPACGVDFSHLPTDALCVVFEHLFRPISGVSQGAGLPLSEFLELWQAVKGVCKHWSEVRRGAMFFASWIS